MAEGRPLLRWPAVLHPLPAAFLGFPVPLPPTATRSLPDGGDEAAVAEPAALQEMIEALGGVDTSYLCAGGAIVMWVEPSSLPLPLYAAGAPPRSPPPLPPPAAAGARSPRRRPGQTSRARRCRSSSPRRRQASLPPRLTGAVPAGLRRSPQPQRRRLQPRCRHLRQRRLAGHRPARHPLPSALA